MFDLIEQFSLSQINYKYGLSLLQFKERINKARVSKAD